MRQGFSMRVRHKLLFPEFLHIAVPIILTNLMGASLHIIDNIMAGSLGDLELASVAQANQLAFILRVALFGAASGCMIFASRHWGDNNLASGEKEPPLKDANNDALPVNVRRATH